MKKHTIGIIGCGDFVRFITKDILKSKKTEIKYLYDLDPGKAKKQSEIIGGAPVENYEEILNNDDIDIVCIFVPPQARKEFIIKATNNNKAILTTKPLGPTTNECKEMVEIVEKNNIACGLIYWRSGNSAFIELKNILESGEFGELALYREDWVHHYPSWNNWALNHNFNGGPFMDAMIHSLNMARYLIKSPPKKAIFFSENYAQSLPVNDTEFMKLDFINGASAYMFISWAPDLEVYNKEGNYREMLNVEYFVTNKAYKITIEKRNDKDLIIISKNGILKEYSIPEVDIYFDKFSDMLNNGGSLPDDLASIREGYEDIKIIREAEKKPGIVFDINLS